MLEEPLEAEGGDAESVPPPPAAEVNEVEIEYQRPWLYPKQVEAIFDPARITCIEASTKAGKTVGAIAWLFEQAILGGGDGKNYWWVAPVSDQAQIAFRRTLAFVPPGMAGSNKSLKTVVLINGAIIWFKSGDRPDSLYGEDVYAAVVDEASRCKEDSWIALRSTLTATLGKCRCIGNVKGRKNWFYRLSRVAEQRADPDLAFHKITAVDAVAAGVLAAKEIADARRDIRNDLIWRELYFAEAGDDQGNPFGMNAIRRAIRPMSSKPPRVWGWDFAKKHDFTVGIALDEDGVTCRFERFRLPWPETIDRVRQDTGKTPALCDSTGVGDPIVEELQRARYAKDGDKLQNLHVASNFEGYHFTQPSKQRLMEGLAASIQGEEVGYPEGPIVNELEQFEYELTRTGVKYSAPEGLFDDCVCALALADRHRKRLPVQIRIPGAALTRSAIFRRH